MDSCFWWPKNLNPHFAIPLYIDSNGHEKHPDFSYQICYFIFDKTLQDSRVISASLQFSNQFSCAMWQTSITINERRHLFSIEEREIGKVLRVEEFCLRTMCARHEEMPLFMRAPSYLISLSHPFNLNRWFRILTTMGIDEEALLW